MPQDRVLTFHDPELQSLLVPGLRIRRGPPPPDLGIGPHAAGGTEWRVVDGEVAVRTTRHTTGAAVEVVGVADYALPDGANTVDGWPGAEISQGLVTEAFQRSVVPLLLSHRGANYLHASAVTTLSGVVALCGRSGTGKSTLAAALVRTGYGFWADDAAVLAVAPGSAPPRSVRLRSTLRLDDESLRLVGSTASPAAPKVGVGEFRPLAGVVVLERGSTRGGDGIERLRAGAALTALLEHALCFSLHGDDRARMVQGYLSLVEGVPVSRLVFTPDPALFPSLVKRLQAVLGPAA